jgi:hypothetical protein
MFFIGHIYIDPSSKKIFSKSFSKEIMPKSKRVTGVFWISLIIVFTSDFAGDASIADIKLYAAILHKAFISLISFSALDETF